VPTPGRSASLFAKKKPYEIGATSKYGLNMKDELKTLDRFFSVYLDSDLSKVAPGQIQVVGSDRRYRREMGYGVVHILWLFVSKGRCLISLQHQMVRPMLEIVKRIKDPEEFRSHKFDQEILQMCSLALAQEQKLSISRGPKYYCSRANLNFSPDPNVRLITKENLKEVVTALKDAGFGPPGIVTDEPSFAYYFEGRPVACCSTAAFGHMKEEVAEVGGVFTLESMRRKGLAKAVVSAVTNAILKSGRVPVYGTSDRNLASKRTALSVGCKEYAWNLSVRYVPDNLKE